MNYKVMRLRVMLLQCKLFLFCGAIGFYKDGVTSDSPKGGNATCTSW